MLEKVKTSSLVCSEKYKIVITNRVTVFVVQFLQVLVNKVRIKTESPWLTILVVLLNTEKNTFVSFGANCRWCIQD